MSAIKIAVKSGDIAAFDAEAIIVNLFEGVTAPAGGTGAVDKALKGLIKSELAFSSVFTGKLGQTLVLNTHGMISARYVIVVGLGKQNDKQNKFGNLQIRRASAAAIRACQRLKVKTAATLLHGAGIGGFDVADAARLVTEGTLLGAYEFTQRKSKAEKSVFKSLTIVEQDAKKLKTIEGSIRHGKIIADNVNLARDLVFDSANNVTPSHLKKLAENIEGLKCEVLEAKDIKKLGMGSFAFVAQGSEAPSYLIHLSYKPKPASKKAKKRVAIIGKGITFDSGGLSLKPSGGMELMKMDMAGAATTLCTMKAISELVSAGHGLDIQVDGFIPTCENMPSGRAGKPGDIVTSMNGKTIEINNTDAEGRLILCDALTYAQNQVDPDEMIDLATLTGACITALGKVASGIMGTDQKLIEGIRSAGDHAGEKFWQLPLYDEYKDALKSDVADLINAGSKGEAGTASAGMFLKEFIDEGRAWVHLDIAGPAYTSKDLPEVPKGATGVGVRTLLYYLYAWN